MMRKTLETLKKNQEISFLTKSKCLSFRLGLFLPRDWKKSVSFFVIGTLIFFVTVFGFAEYGRSLVLKKKVLGTASVGLEFLNSGTNEFSEFKWNDAQNNFLQVSQTTDQIRKQVQEAGGVLGAAFSVLPQGQDLEYLLNALDHISQSLVFLVDGVRSFEDSRLVWELDDNQSSPSFFNSIWVSHQNLVKSERELSSALEMISRTNLNLLPEDVQIKLAESGQQLVAGHKAVKNLIEFEGLVLKLLGGEKKTYLLLFMNNNELRSTGGFIGTYGIINFDNGKMKIDRIESVYMIDGQLKEQIAAPGPLRRIASDHWGLRDSNWFVDFDTNSRKALMFLEKETGILANGVIAMTPNLFERLLGLTGPIEMTEYGEVLDAQNFREVVQFKTSIDYDKEENRPKKFLSDFAPLFLSRLKDLDKTKWVEVISLMTEMIAQKQMLMFSLDPAIQNMIESYGASGTIKDTQGDYLAIFHSNVGGGKTDQGIVQKVSKKVVIDDMGSATVTLNISRNHQSYKEKYFPKNIDFMRVLVPFGSKLISARGFDDFDLADSSVLGASTDSDLRMWSDSFSRAGDADAYVGYESGYTVFANWLELDPGETKNVEITYRLPSDYSEVYTQLLQQQPGGTSYEFDLTVDHPGSIQFVYPERSQSSGGRVEFQSLVNSDQFYALVGKR